MNGYYIVIIICLLCATACVVTDHEFFAMVFVALAILAENGE